MLNADDKFVESNRSHALIRRGGVEVRSLSFDYYKFTIGINLKQIDLVDELGSKSRVSEVLNRKRKLTIEMIRRLSVKLNLSVSVLVNDYGLVG